MLKIPDRMELIYEGQVIYDSGFMVGRGEAVVYIDGTEEFIQVRMIAPQEGTAWTFSLLCPIDDGFDPSVAPTILHSPVPTTEPSASKTPSFAPTTFIPTDSPSTVPSYEPTVSQVPSLHPSVLPTLFPTLSAAPTLLPTEACADFPDWYDSDGPKFDCSWYADKQNCLFYGDSYENFGLTATGACCVCGGGMRNDFPSAAPSATPSAIPSAAPSALPSESPTVKTSTVPSLPPTGYPTIFVPKVVTKVDAGGILTWQEANQLYNLPTREQLVASGVRPDRGVAQEEWHPVIHEDGTVGDYVCIGTFEGNSDYLSYKDYFSVVPLWGDGNFEAEFRVPYLFAVQ